MGFQPIITTTGMMPYTTALEIHAAMIRRFLATTLAMARIRSGRAVGDDSMGNQIGMAPEAKWIGCRNMDQGNGTPARYLECMEWFLAPYPIGGGQGDPTKAPDITVNAWHCPPSEGCSVSTLQAAIEAQAAAGIMTVVRADSTG